MGKNKDIMMSKKEIMRAKKETEKQERLIKSLCAHQKKNGKLAVRPIGNRGDYICEICDEEFNMNPVSSQDLQAAIQVVHNAIQQCRAWSDIESDEKIIRALGETDYNIGYVLPALYKKILTHYSKDGKKKNKNNNHREDEFGSYANGRFSSFGRR